MARRRSLNPLARLAAALLAAAVLATLFATSAATPMKPRTSTRTRTPSRTPTTRTSTATATRSPTTSSRPATATTPAMTTATAAPTPSQTRTAGTGLPGGWSIAHSASVNGALFVHARNTDKDGAIVAARVASALGGLGIAATSDAREALLNPTKMADSNYVDNATAFIVDELYGALARAGDPAQPLMSPKTVVFSSVHRLGLYTAEVLHGLYLPLQIMSFADSWTQVEAAAQAAALIVGHDFDYGGLWLWNKIAAGAPGTRAGSLPPAYARALAAADQVVVVQPNDNWVYCTPSYCWDAINQTYTGASNVFLHTSLTRSTFANTATQLYNQAVVAGKIGLAASTDVANLKQWEWGVPDSAISNIRSAWAALGKPASALKVVPIGVVDGFAAVPKLWQAYLSKNGLAPRGIHVESYWAAFPALERAGAVLPFPSYTWYTPDWHPLDDNARAILASVCGVGPCTPAFANNSRAFANGIGSSGDDQGIRQLMADFALDPAHGGFFGWGINAASAGGWTGWGGEAVPAAWEVAAADLRDGAKSPYVGRAWVPMDVAGLCGVVPCV